MLSNVLVTHRAPPANRSSSTSPVLGDEPLRAVNEKRHRRRQRDLYRDAAPLALHRAGRFLCPVMRDDPRRAHSTAPELITLKIRLPIHSATCGTTLFPSARNRSTR